MRAFVAARFERNSEIIDLEEILEKDSRLRKVPESQRHVTLLFFPDMDARTSESICDTVRSLRQESFKSISAGITGFPYPKRSRVVVLLIESTELKYLHRQFVDASMVEFDRKDFRPHITLARSRNRPVDVSEYEKRGQGIEIRFTEIALVRSILTPHGPEYSNVCSVQLM